MRLRIKPRFWAFAIAVTVFVFGISFLAMQLRYAQGVERLRQAREQRNALSLAVSDLSDQLAYAQTDAYIVRIARDELGMIMPGEVRYVNGAR